MIVPRLIFFLINFIPSRAMISSNTAMEFGPEHLLFDKYYITKILYSCHIDVQVCRGVATVEHVTKHTCKAPSVLQLISS